MVQYFIDSIPILLALFVYFVSLERRVAKIQADICWIKKLLTPVKVKTEA